MVKDYFAKYTFYGNHNSIGKQHGESLRDSIQQHLELSYQLAYKNSNIQKEQALRIASSFKKNIEQYHPGFVEELQGLAEAARISLNEALLLQVRQEVVNLSKFGADGFECTTFALPSEYTGDGKVYSGQNADLSGNFEDISNIISFEVQGKPKVMMVVPAGQISYIGVNSEGMSANGNFLSCKGWKKGFPRYLLSRLALEQPTFDEACKKIESIHKRASSRNLLLADYKGNIADYEITATDYRRISVENFLVHSNHFIHPDMLKYELADGYLMSNSIVRRERLIELIKANKGEINNDKIKYFLADHEKGEHSLCVHANQQKEYHTFTSTINNLTDRIIEVTKGNPCCNEYKAYCFK